MTDETTTEQLAEIEGQATEYTPPDGWRVLAVGERLRDGDVTVRRDGYQYPTERVGGWVGSNQRYIRPIEPQPEPVPEPQGADTAATEYTPPEGWRLLAVGELVMLDDQWVRQDGSVWRSMGTEGPVSEGARYIRRIEPEPVQVREGRWRTRCGEVKNIRPCEPLKGAYFVWPWTDGFMTFQDNGRHQGSQESPNDLVEYLGPIEQQPQPQPQQDGLVRDVTHLLQESGVLDSAKAEQQIEELRSEVSYVQRLLGESQRRVTQLEELVASLRTINEAQEKSVRLAGQANTDLQHRLDVVSAEWAEQLETVRKLQIELDAAQQVPQAVSDRFEEGWDAGTARTVETIAEWLEPIKGAIDAADNVAETERAGNLAADIIRALPAIMRSLTGLTSED